MKKFVVVFTVVIFIVFGISYCGNSDIKTGTISDKEWAEYEKNSKVNIDKTFTGTIKEIIDKYILYNIEISYEKADQVVVDDKDTLYVKKLHSKDKNYYNEFETVVHKTFSTKKNGDEITSYISYDYRGYSFVNGDFVENSACSRIPAKITLKEVGDNTYKVICCVIAQDGEYYAPSIKRMFPTFVRGEYYADFYHRRIEKKLFENAQNYLQVIGRKAEIKDYLDTTELLSYRYDDESMGEAEIDRLYDLLQDFEWKDYPTWIGTREVVRNGKRYIYMAEEKKLGKRKYLITYTKIDENGNMLEQYKVNVDKADYKIEKVV